jgi:hypothetical protein
VESFSERDADAAHEHEPDRDGERPPRPSSRDTGAMELWADHGR